MSEESRLCGNCFFEVTKGEAGFCPRCGYPLEPTSLPDALPVGSILNGRYVVGRPLGQGGFGITYKALDHKTSNVVAIKEYFPGTLCHRRTEAQSITISTTGTNDDFYWGRERFLREAETLAGLGDLPGIVHVHEYFEENGTAYFSMDFVEGRDLKGYLKEHGGRLRWSELRGIVYPVMTALDAVHQRGIIHRDISPDNIYIKDSGEAVLLDFGAARASLGERSKSISVILKPGFAPKEQYFSHGKQGPFTDVYAMGATIYRCLAGIEPPESLERSEAVGTGEQDPLKPIHDYVPGIDSSLEQTVLKAMSINAEDRYQTMGEFERALKSTDQKDQTTTLPKPVAVPLVAQAKPSSSTDEKSIGKRVARGDEGRKGPMLSRRALIGIACGAGIAAVAGVAVAALNNNSNPNPEPAPDPSDTTETSDSIQTQNNGGISLDQAYAVLYSDGELVFQEGEGTEDGREVLHADAVDTSAPWWIGTYKTTLTIGEGPTITGDWYDKVNKVSSSTQVKASGSLSRLFTCCTNLTDLSGLSSWDMSAVSDISGMFQGCFALADLSPLSSWDVSSVQDMTYLFNADSALSDVSPLSSWDMSKCKTMKGIFAGCTSIRTVSDLGSWDVSSATTLGELFKNCSVLTDISGLSSWDVSLVSDMSSIFFGCESLKDITALAPWNVSSVAQMSNVFGSCRFQDVAPLASWDVSNVTSTHGLFDECASLADLSGLASWKLNANNDMQSMFSGCTALRDLSPLSSWDVSSVTLMGGLFRGCSALGNLNGLTSWNVSSVTSMQSMFESCTALTDVSGIAGWNVSAVTDMAYMFEGCTVLKDVGSLASWDTSSLSETTNMFANCPATPPTWYTA